jgi:hypothetical protein
VSLRCDVGFCDTCLMLQGDKISWDSLLICVLCVMDDYSRTIVFTIVYMYFFLIFLCGNVIEILFGVFVHFLCVDVFLRTIKCCSVWTVICISQFPNFPLIFNLIPRTGHPVIAIAVRNGLNTVGSPPPFHPTTDRDQVWEASYFHEY